MQRIGDYEVEREIARGAMGVVLRAHDASGRSVAIKRILVGAQLDESDLVRFRHEGEIARSLRHPNIVSLIEAGADTSGPYQVLELVEGHSLKQVLAARGRLSPRRVAELGRALASALQCAHDHGVIHRDLKPANVLLDREGQPRLTDFGLAKLLDRSSSLTATGEILGTPLFMAPEQVRAERHEIGPRTDVYGLGATLYQALTGQTPIEGDSVHTVLGNVLSVDPTPPRRLVPGLDQRLEAIVLRCLEKEPSRRYASAAELGEALDAWLTAHPPEAATAPPPNAAGARVVALSVVLLALAIAIGLIAFTRRPGPALAEAEPTTSAVASSPATPAPEALPLPKPKASRSPPASRHSDPDVARLLELAGDPESGELAEAALLVSKLTLSPDLVIERELARLDDLAASLRPQLEGLVGPARTRRLVELAHEQIVQGDQTTYQDPRNSCLDQVLARGRGIQITCALVVLALGRRLDVPLLGVCFPGSFVLVEPGPEGDVVDAFQGRVLDRRALERRLVSEGRSPELLRPSSRQLILVRLAHFMAGNLDAQGQRGASQRALALVQTLAPDDTPHVIEQAFGAD